MKAIGPFPSIAWLYEGSTPSTHSLTVEVMTSLVSRFVMVKVTFQSYSSVTEEPLCSTDASTYEVPTERSPGSPAPTVYVAIPVPSELYPWLTVSIEIRISWNVDKAPVISSRLLFVISSRTDASSQK